MELQEKLKNLTIEQLEKLHSLLGLDQEYGFDSECKGDYIMHIFEKDEKIILEKLGELDFRK